MAPYPFRDLYADFLLTALGPVFKSIRHGVTTTQVDAVTPTLLKQIRFAMCRAYRRRDKRWLKRRSKYAVYRNWISVSYHLAQHGAVDIGVDDEDWNGRAAVGQHLTQQFYADAAVRCTRSLKSRGLI